MGGARLVWAEHEKTGTDEGAEKVEGALEWAWPSWSGRVVARVGGVWELAAGGRGTGVAGRYAVWSLHRCGRDMGLTRQVAAFTHLLQLQPHFVEGSKPVGLGPGHGVLTLLAFLILLSPETEARDVMRLQGRPSLDPQPLE